MGVIKPTSRRTRPTSEAIVCSSSRSFIVCEFIRMLLRLLLNQTLIQVLPSSGIIDSRGSISCSVTSNNTHIANLNSCRTSRSGRWSIALPSLNYTCCCWSHDFTILKVLPLNYRLVIFALHSVLPHFRLH